MVLKKMLYSILLLSGLSIPVGVIASTSDIEEIVREDDQVSLDDRISNLQEWLDETFPNNVFNKDDLGLYNRHLNELQEIYQIVLSKKSFNSDHCEKSLKRSCKTWCYMTDQVRIDTWKNYLEQFQYSQNNFDRDEWQLLLNIISDKMFEMRKISRWRKRIALTTFTALVGLSLKYFDITKYVWGNNENK